METHNSNTVGGNEIGESPPSLAENEAAPSARSPGLDFKMPNEAGLSEAGANDTETHDVPEQDHTSSLIDVEANIPEQQSAAEVADVDRCRICRGEGTKEEELFYPCKCNGSIRYVHQNCLVEWLSHSHKKHCELCKTPFRFTKLYDSHMPRSVPIPVFLRQAIVNGWKNLLTYIRVLLVVFVWCFWLPWCMRAVWRGLFWLGDGGWVDWRKRSLAEAPEGSHTDRILDLLHMPSNLPGSPEALAASLMSAFSNAWTNHRAMLQNLWAAEKQQPLALRLFKTYYRIAFKRYSPSRSTTGAYPTPTPAPTVRPASWLSDISFFSSITRSPTLNGIIIDTLEGQLITGLIIATFIVLFLIREWVVQQQQNLFVGADVEQNGDVLEEVAQNGEVNEGAEQAVNVQQLQAQNPPRVLLQPTRRLQRRATHAEGDNVQNRENARTTLNEAYLTAVEPSSDDMSASGENHLNRPLMPDRGATGAVEIRRDLDEHADLPPGQDQAGVQVFKDLWSRADQKPRDVLRIIEEENKIEELDWIVKFMKKLENVPPSADSLSSLPSSHGEREAPHPDHESNIVRESQAEGNSNENERPNTAQREDLFKSMLISDRASATSSEPPRIFPSDRPDDSLEALQLEQPRLVNLSAGTISRPSSQPQQHQVLALPPRVSRVADGADPDAADEAADTASRGITAERPYETGTSGAAEINRDNNDDISSNVTRQPQAEPPARKMLFESLLDFMWGETPSSEQQRGALALEDEERVVVDLADEAPFVPANRQQLLLPPEQADEPEPAPDPDAAAAPAPEPGAEAAAADPFDDLEDVDGVMDLIGMQGPLFVLVQNGMFCAFLVSASIAATVFMPYMTGKIFLIALAHPLHMMQQPLRIASMTADMIVDTSIILLGLSYYWVDRLVWVLCWPVRWMFPPMEVFMETSLIAHYARSYAARALNRLTAAELIGIMTQGPDIPRLSVISHESLKILIATASDSMLSLANATNQAVTYIQSSAGLADFLVALYNQLNQLFWHTVEISSGAVSLIPSILNVNLWKINLGTSLQSQRLNWALASWSAEDRSIAIFAGYLAFFLAGLWYLEVMAAVKGKNRRGKVDGELANGLYQAGGVLKVIVIISIEMIVFPLYCGVLLDIAMLPLFGHASLASRASFALASPRISLFMHWFVGTCYMFHFALFVSMCRKIMRNGVLCKFHVSFARYRLMAITVFIRDPDDPTFHPVRDVLERNLAAQLSKILFSGLVYAGLILGSLGGVVWGLDRWTNGVFPIKWSSSEPILEFPIDVLFYNFLLPLVIRYCKPANGLTKVYDWWLHKCARLLRLSHFLFKEEHLDEKGAHIRRRWKDWLMRKPANISAISIAKDGTFSIDTDEDDVAFRPNGKMVQAPSSDQLRIPKGIPTFFQIIEVNEFVNVDDNSKAFYDKNHESFTLVYIPPHFRLRISALVILLWLFAATTGVSVTILPLVFGRFILARLTPQDLRMNDIYSISLGLYILGGAGYAILNLSRFRTYLNNKVSPHTSNIKATAQKAGHVSLHILRLVYTYSAFTLLFPGLISLLIEFYLVIPLGTFLASFRTNLPKEPLSIASSFSSNDANVPSLLSRPMIHLIQDWTLGVLYTKVIGRLILWSGPSRPATALRGIVRHGWLNPDISLATRGFILPATIVVAILVAIPAAIGWLASRTFLSHLASRSDYARTCIYRYAYPAALAAAVAGLLLWVLGEAFGRWRRRVRDEVYLIGERLHNYGEARRGSGSGDKGKGKEKEKVERPVLTRTVTA